MSRLIDWISEHPYKIISIILIVILCLLAFACQPKAGSMIEPGRMVNKFELQAELDIIITRFEDKFESLSQQEAFRHALFNASLEMFRTGTIDPLGVILTLGGILGFGAGADDVRLRRKIKRTNLLTPPADPAMT